MKIKRSTEFNPVEITLETEQEVMELLDAVDENKNETCRRISDWFTAHGFEIS